MNTSTFDHAVRLGLGAALLCVFLAGQSQAQPSVVINEFMADNRAALENNGDFPDWVELYNLTGQAIDLGDWSLTDNLSQPRKFVFPAGTLIQPNGFLLIYCDDRLGSPGLHTGFSLNDKGETLALFDTLANGGVQRDSVVFGLQLPDQSNGRVPDFVGDFTLNNPTPLGPNSPVTFGNPAALKINEWSALNGPSAIDPEPDWFELYNPDRCPFPWEDLCSRIKAACRPRTRRSPACRSLRAAASSSSLPTTSSLRQTTSISSWAAAMATAFCFTGRTAPVSSMP
jgi:hypothetical protein